MKSKKIFILLMLLSNLILAQSINTRYIFRNNTQVNQKSYADCDIYIDCQFMSNFYFGGAGMYLKNNGDGLFSPQLASNAPKIIGADGQQYNDPNVTNLRLCDLPKNENGQYFIDIPSVFGSRMYLGFGAPIYRTNGNNPLLDDPANPNYFTPIETIELTTGTSIFTNTSRVDQYKYPIGEVLHCHGNTYIDSVGETISHEQLISKWKRFVPEAFQNSYDPVRDVITQMGHTPYFINGSGSTYYESFFDDLWEFARNNTMTVHFDNQDFVMNAVGDILTIGGVSFDRKKMNLGDICGGGGQFIGSRINIVFGASINRGVVLATSAVQVWDDPKLFFQNPIHNWYTHFFHTDLASKNSKTYALAFDDVFDQSSTQNCNGVDSVIVVLGGFGMMHKQVLTNVYISPLEPVVDQYKTIQLTVSGLDKTDIDMTIPANAVTTWSVKDPNGHLVDLINEKGLFGPTDISGDYLVTVKVESEGKVFYDTKTLKVNLAGITNQECVGILNTKADYKLEVIGSKVYVTIIPGLLWNGDGSWVRLFFGNSLSSPMGANQVILDKPYPLTGVFKGDEVYFSYQWKTATGQDGSNIIHIPNLGTCEGLTIKEEIIQLKSSQAVAIKNGEEFSINVTGITNKGNTILSTNPLFTSSIKFEGQGVDNNGVFKATATGVFPITITYDGIVIKTTITVNNSCNTVGNMNLSTNQSCVGKSITLKTTNYSILSTDSVIEFQYSMDRKNWSLVKQIGPLNFSKDNNVTTALDQKGWNYFRTVMINSSISNCLNDTAKFEKIGQIDSVFVNASVLINAVPSSINICSGQLYAVTAADSLNTNGSIQWTTTGDGVFNNATQLLPTYTPGDLDKINSTIKLYIIGKAKLGCESLKDSILLTINKPFAIKTTIINVSCFGKKDGVASISVIGGKAPFSYSLDGGLTSQSTGEFNNIKPGTFALKVNDVNSCTKDSSITIIEPLTISITKNITSASCNLSNGSFEIVPAGGTSPYTYAFNGITLFDDIATMNSIAKGVYDVKVKDKNDCIYSDNVTVISNGGVSIIKVDTVGINCKGNSDGKILITATSTELPIMYSLDNGLSYQSLGDFSNLSAKSYSIMVKDNVGCTAPKIVTLHEPNVKFAIKTTIINVSCFGKKDGVASISVIGGKAPFSYSLDGGLTSQSTGEFNNIKPGTFALKVNDVNSCTKDSSITIIEPLTISITKNITSASCNLSNGSFEIVPAGGTSPYTYAFNGITLFDDIATMNSIAKGVYAVKVKDKNDCVYSDNVTVISNGGISILKVDTVGISCNSTSDGKILITASSIELPITYSLDNGLSYQSLGDFSNLSAKSYSIMVKDNVGCTTKKIVTLHEPHLPFANAGPDITVNEGLEIILLGSGGGDYLWISTDDLSDVNIANPTLIAKDSKSFVLEVTDPTSGCKSLDSMKVIVEKSIVFSNLISINGDGVNDTWEIKNIENFPKVSIQIFNRWGNLVWENSDNLKSWDGSNSKTNELLMEGTYFYTIDFHNSNMSKYNGYIQLVR